MGVGARHGRVQDASWEYSGTKHDTSSALCGGCRGSGGPVCWHCPDLFESVAELCSGGDSVQQHRARRQEATSRVTRINLELVLDSDRHCHLLINC